MEIDHIQHYRSIMKVEEEENGIGIWKTMMKILASAKEKMI
jgi:hypothetical protein